MELQEFMNHMNAGKRVIAGSEVHQFMNAASFEVMKLTNRLSASHDLSEIQELFAQITGKPVNRTFALFPPFYTDFGKNSTVEDGVFINSGCHFQDQGGIVIGEGTLIGHNVVLATLSHDMDLEHRKDLHPAPIKIGEHVWIGPTPCTPQIMLSGTSICWPRRRIRTRAPWTGPLRDWRAGSPALKRRGWPGLSSAAGRMPLEPSRAIPHWRKPIRWEKPCKEDDL